MLELLKRLFGLGDYSGDKMFSGVPRSPQWPKVRAAHLLKEPVCQICGGKDNLTVHHLLPFHMDKSMELDALNLMTLCEGAGNGNHHLIYGHWGNYRTKWNPTLRSETTLWLSRFTAKNMGVDNTVADPD